MNKEVQYILRGFLITMLLLAFAIYIQSLLEPASRPPAAAAMPSASQNMPIVINEKGKAIFVSKCSSCHCIWKDDCISMERWGETIPDKKLLYDWIRNSSGVLRSGNKYFNQLVKKFGNVRMPDFPELTNEDIDAILEYIKQEYAIMNNKRTPAL